jgi:hypothetical protein
VACNPVTGILAAASTVTAPTAPVPATPVTLTFASAVTVTAPTLAVAANPVTRAFASAIILTVPTLPIDPGSASFWPQGPPPQLWLPALKVDGYISHYAIRIIALLESAVGNTTVKSPAVDVLSPPKSRTITAGLVRAIDVVFGVVL